MKGTVNLPKRLEELKIEIFLPRFFKTRNLGLLLLTTVLLITAPLWAFLLANYALILMIMYDFYEIGKGVGTLKFAIRLQDIRCHELIEDMYQMLGKEPEKKKKKVEKEEKKV